MGYDALANMPRRQRQVKIEDGVNILPGNAGAADGDFERTGGERAVGHQAGQGVAAIRSAGSLGPPALSWFM